MDVYCTEVSNVARKLYIERHKSVPILRKLFPSQDTKQGLLTLPMMRLLWPKAQGPGNSCHVGIYWIAHDV